jgi:hypothetical protein
VHSAGPHCGPASSLRPSPAGPCQPAQRIAWSPCHGHVHGGTVACPVWLTGGLSVDEVFTTTTGAPWGGGRAGRGDEVLTPTVGRQRGVVRARFRSRRDADGEGSKKGCGSDSSAFYRCGGGVEEGRAGDGRRPRGGEGLGTAWGTGATIERPAPAQNWH